MRSFTIWGFACWLMLSIPTLSAQPGIQLALLLDTSNSMDGLIDQAKSQLWRVVNEFATLHRDDQIPQLEISLYEYGNSRLSNQSGYVRQVAPLTRDLDRISEELFALTTKGGDEYCGKAIRDALDELDWNEGSEVMKIIFIAGNESFQQGRIDFRKSCKDAIARGIMVNTIFCGDQQSGIDLLWKKGADLADGKYMNIDQDQQVVHISAPQDSLIGELNEELNTTYIGYGNKGEQMKSRQLLQDANALKMGSAIQAERAVSKSGAFYRNSSWDLVDAVEDDAVDLASLPESSMPAEMRPMSATERTAYVEQLAKTRKALQGQIAQLSVERQKYIAQKQKSQPGVSLDDALVGAVREQASRYGFTKR